MSPRSSAMTRLRYSAAPALGKHQRKAQRRLQPHFFSRAAPVIAKNEYRTLRPAMTFGQHRRREQNGRGGDGKSDAQAVIVIAGEERPIERNAQIVDVPDIVGQIVEGDTRALSGRREQTA